MSDYNWTNIVWYKKHWIEFFSYFDDERDVFVYYASISAPNEREVFDTDSFRTKEEAKQAAIRMIDEQTND